MALDTTGIEERQTFTNTWGIQRIKDMSLEEYTNLDKSTNTKGVVNKHVTAKIKAKTSN